jgi:hypothetical protein
LGAEASVGAEVLVLLVVVPHVFRAGEPGVALDERTLPRGRSAPSPLPSAPSPDE